MPRLSLHISGCLGTTSLRLEETLALTGPRRYTYNCVEALTIGVPCVLGSRGPGRTVLESALLQVHRHWGGGLKPTPWSFFTLLHYLLVMSWIPLSLYFSYSVALVRRELDRTSCFSAFCLEDLTGMQMVYKVKLAF